MRLVLLLALMMIAAPTHAQKRKSKNSYARGTLFLYGGYNRSFYTKSDIHFQGNGYDFEMKGSRAYDNPDRIGAKFVDARIVTPQFNARIGYYIRDHWAISVGFDQMKYLFADRNEVRLSGTMLDTTYPDTEFITDRSTFHYANTGMSSYLRFEVTRTDQWFATRSKDFAVSTNLGLGTGALLTYNDFRFAGQEDRHTSSLSGYGISGHIGLRLEFFKHVFLQGNFNGGFLHQLNVKTRPDEPAARAKHHYGYGQVDAVLGFLFYIRPTNDCNSCPHW